MREVEFLPSWYRNVRRYRLYLKLQLWTSFALVAALAFYLVGARTRSALALTEYETASHDLITTRGQVKELDMQVELQRALLAKQRLVAQLGMPVELTRAISEVARCMPEAMSLDEMNFQTLERELSISEHAGRATPGKSDELPTKTRTLHVVLKGVAPSEAQVTTFYSRLSDRRFLDKVRLDKSSERRAGDRVMREFELSFDIPLDYRQASAGDH